MARKLTGAGAVGDGNFRCGEDGRDAVGEADVEQHSFGNFAGHFAGFEIDDEELLLAFDFARVGALFFHSDEDGAGMVAEIDGELEELFGLEVVFDAFDGADADVERIERGEGDGWFDCGGRESGHELSPETFGISGNGERGVAACVADWRVGDEAKRDDAGPDFEGIVVGIVFDVADANFGGDFGERQFEDAGGFEFFFVGLARVVPTAGENFFGEGAEGGEFFGGIVDELRGAECDDGTVVHGVIENGAGEDEAVGKRDGDADGEAGRKIAKHAASGGAVEVNGIVDSGEHGGDDVCLRVDGKADVADKGFVEDGVDGGAIVNGALRLADDASAFRRCDRIGHGGHRG